MKKFTDSEGDQWNVQVTLATAKRLRADGRDLLDAKKVNAMLGDPIELFDLLYLVCEPQAQERGVSDEEFGARLAGVSESAINALVEELQLFFQQVGRPAMSAMLGRVWKATKMEQSQATDLMNGEKAEKAIQSVVSQAMAAAEVDLDRLAGATFTEQREP